MSTKPWAGEQELQSALQGLVGTYPTPASKVKSIISVANKYANEFKMVVYEVERFIKKANNQDKIAGILVIDALCRQANKEKDVFAKRFAIRLKETVGFLTKMTSQDKATLSKVYEEWKKHETFPADILSTVKVEYVAPQSSSQFDNIVNSSSSSSNKVENAASSKPAVRAEEVIRSASSAASSAAIDDSKKRASKEKEKEKEKEKDSSKSKKSKPAPEAVKKAVKLCPFREGNCPYGEKCRFNHHETNTLEQYAARLVRSCATKRILIEDPQTELFPMNSLKSQTNLFHPDIANNLPEDDSFITDYGSLFKRRKLASEFTTNDQLLKDPITYELDRNCFEQLFLPSV